MIPWMALLAFTAGMYHLDGIATSSPGANLTRAEYRVMAGKSPLQRFAITNVRRTDRCILSERPVVLYSPFLLPGSFYEITETGNYSQSVAGKLALDGYDVWLLDQRRTGLAPGSCEQGSADCSVMANWDFTALSNDGLLAALLAGLMHPGQRPVIGGFSAGANLAMAVANRAPHAFAGLFLYEGTFYSEDPATIAHNAGICANLGAALDAGQYYDPSAQIYAPLLSLAETRPSDLSPFPVFPPGTTNQLAMLYLYSAPAPAGAVAPTPGFVRCIADFQTQTFLYTNPARLFLSGPKFDNYAPLAPMRDLACGLAGQDSRHYDQLSSFDGDLLIFVEGTGFGDSLLDTATLFENSRSVRVNQHPELGEADPYFHYDWQNVFYAPLEQWLRSVRF